MPPTPDPGRVHQSAGMLKQLLAGVIIEHAPWTAEISERTKRKVADEWLESLEAHSTTLLAPLMAEIRNAAPPHPAIEALLANAEDPSAQYGSLGQQFLIYGVMFTIGSALLQPFVQSSINATWKLNQVKVLTPPDIATMVVRGIARGGAPITPVPEWALDEAAQNGLAPDAMQALVDATGNPPAPQDLFEMIRRGIIDEPTLRQGIKEGDTRDEWIDNLVKLRYVTPTPIDMVRAAVQNQLDPTTAAKYAADLGLEPQGWVRDNPDWWTILYDIAGRPPGPEEVGRAANRGFVDWEGLGPKQTTFQQAIAESDIKDKWEPILRQLAQYFPPPEQVGNLLRHGGITRDQAIALWEAGGVPTELATAYAHLAEVEQVTQDRALAKGDVLTLVQEGTISDADALTMLAQIGYSGDSATYLVGMAHFRYNLDALRVAIRRVSTLYTSYKITATDANSAFAAIGIPDAQRSSILTTLAAQREAEVLRATPAQIAAGLYYQLYDQDTAMTKLEELGYDAWDAWVVLSVRMHAKLPNEPGQPINLLPLPGIGTPP